MEINTVQSTYIYLLQKKVYAISMVNCTALTAIREAVCVYINQLPY